MKYFFCLCHFPYSMQYRFAVSLILAAVGGGLFAQEVNYTARLTEVLEGYQELLAVKLDDDMKDRAADAWEVVSMVINEGYLRFTVNPEAKGLLSGTRFNPGKDVSYVIFSQYLLDLWTKYPSTVYGMTASVFQEVAIFFTDPQAWFAAQADIMERLLLIKMERYTAQAELIQQRLLPGGYLLSDFDTYILDSFEKDSLVSVVLFQDRFSLPVADALYQLRLAYEKSHEDKSLRAAIVEFGEKLFASREALPKNSADEEVYPLAIAVHSWLEFTPYLMARIHNRTREANPLTFDEILKTEKDYNKLRRKLETSRTADFPLIERVIKEYQ